MLKRTAALSTVSKYTLGLILTIVTASAMAEQYFTISDGQLERPTGYREWVYVGTPVTPNDLNDGKAAFPEHHNVYIDPDSWAHWKKTDDWVFTQYYPVLRAGKAAGEKGTGGKWSDLSEEK